MSPDYTAYEARPDEWMKGAPGQTYTPRGGLPVLFFADTAPAMKGNDFVEGLLSASSLVVVYGEPGSGKSFWVLDLCLHIASGREWNGREVEGGPVVYAALEGGNGIRNRIVAARRRMKLPPETPFALIQCPIDLCTNEIDTAKLIVSINEVARAFGRKVRLVVIDTLFRALAGGNENAADDMGALVHNADLIREETGACVLFVHHCGKEAARGMRGHSSLKAATDTEIEITRKAETAISVAKVTRQRELETSGTFAFRLESVELGEDQRGKPVRSCVVAPIDPPPAGKEKSMRLHEEAVSLHRHICDLVAAAGEAMVPEPGMPPVQGTLRQTLHSALLQKGWLLSKLSKTPPESGESPESIAESEWKRLWKRLNVLQINGLIGFNRRHVWLGKVESEA